MSKEEAEKKAEKKKDNKGIVVEGTVREDPYLPFKYKHFLQTETGYEVNIGGLYEVAKLAVGDEVIITVKKK